MTTAPCANDQGARQHSRARLDPGSGGPGRSPLGCGRCGAQRRRLPAITVGTSQARHVGERNPRRIGQAAFEAAWAAGQALSLEDAVAEALALTDEPPSMV